MDNVILGFLMIRSLTQYDLLQALQKKVSPFYKASLGSIQHALKKLLEQAYIISEPIEDDPRKRLLYHITPLGTSHFLSWMKKAPDENKLEAQITTKLFFLSHLDQAARLEVIKTIINCLEEIVSHYEHEKETLADQEWPDEVKETVYYQLKTLDLGYNNYASTLNWFKALLIQEASI